MEKKMVRFYLNGVAISDSIPSGICEAYDASVALENARNDLANLQEEMEYSSSISPAEYSAALCAVASAEKRIAALKAAGRI